MTLASSFFHGARKWKQAKCGEKSFFCLCAYREGGVSERREGRGRE